MFRMTWKDWIENPTAKKSADFKFKSRILRQPESVIGAGLMSVGLVLTVFGAWKAGIYDFERAEFVAMNEAGLFRK